MDTARDRRTGKIVCATDLWSLDEVNEYAYECVSCGVTLEPASYKKDFNLKRPYFRRYRDTTHSENCGLKRIEKLRSGARKKSISTSEGFPLPYPNKLILEDTYHRTNRSFSKGGIRSETANSQISNSQRHNHTTDTIRPLVKFYLDYPFDRDYLSLEVPDVEGHTYEEVFQYLYHIEDVYYQKPKIFYGSLNYKKTDVHREFAEVKLSQGSWKILDSKKVLTNPYVVRIDMSDWTETVKSCVLDEIAITRKEVMVAHRAGNKKMRGLLFFIGTQDSSNRFLFHVKDYRLICCVADVMEIVSRNRTGSSNSNTDASFITVPTAITEESQIVKTFKPERLQDEVQPSRIATPNAGNARMVEEVSKYKSLLHKQHVDSNSLAALEGTKVQKHAPLEEFKNPPQIADATLKRKIEPTRKPSVRPEYHVTGLKRIAHWLRRWIEKF